MSNAINIIIEIYVKKKKLHSRIIVNYVKSLKWLLIIISREMIYVSMVLGIILDR